MHEDLSANTSAREIVGIQIQKTLFPTLDGIVAEGHIGSGVTFIKRRMAVGKEDILAQRMDLPEFKRRVLA